MKPRDKEREKKLESDLENLRSYCIEHGVIKVSLNMGRIMRERRGDYLLNPRVPTTASDTLEFVRASIEKAIRTLRELEASGQIYNGIGESPHYRIRA